MSPRKQSLGFLLADVSRLMRRAFQQNLEGCSLTLTQAKALIYVSHHEGVRQVDLADLLEVQPITLARLIDQLEEAGLVERRPAPNDRRAHQIYLTPAAGTQLDAIEQVGLTTRASALVGLNDKQIETVFLALEQMRENLSTR